MTLPLAGPASLAGAGACKVRLDLCWLRREGCRSRPVRAGLCEPCIDKLLRGEGYDDE